MVRTHALMESLSANLSDFLHSVHSEMTRPQKKFLRDGLLSGYRGTTLVQDDSEFAAGYKRS